MADLNAFIRGIPKADIHIHLEGLITPTLFAKLHHRNKCSSVSLNPFQDVYGSLRTFIDACRTANSVILTEDDCCEVVSGYMRTCADDNVVHVELEVEPEFHFRRGITYETLMSGIQRGLDFGWHNFGISHSLVLSLVRDLPEENAMISYQRMTSHRVHVDAVGLASNELGHPPSKFRRTFERAQKAGYRLVMHAGEEGPASYIWETLSDIGVDRIDHGLSATQDRNLVSFLELSQTPLAMCPVSNMKLGYVSTIAQHPILEMFRSGLLVSINTDDPGILQTSLVENYRSVAIAFALSQEEIARLARNSILSSFANNHRKNILLKQLAAYVAAARDMM